MIKSALKLMMWTMIVAAPVALAATPEFKEGQWNVQYSMEVTGMPFKMPPITGSRSSCLNQKNFVPDTSQAGQYCQNLDVKVNGNIVTWTMKCTSQQGSIEGQGRVTYKSDSYDGSMDARMISATTPNLPVSYRYTMSGKHVGACAPQ